MLDCIIQYKFKIGEIHPLLSCLRLTIEGDFFLKNVKTSCNEVLEFLRGMPLDSLLVLNSGDIYIEENPELMLEEISNTKEMFERMDNK